MILLCYITCGNVYDDVYYKSIASGEKIASRKNTSMNRHLQVLQ